MGLVGAGTICVELRVVYQQRWRVKDRLITTTLPRGRGPENAKHVARLVLPSLWLAGCGLGHQQLDFWVHASHLLGFDQVTIQQTIDESAQWWRWVAPV